MTTPKKDATTALLDRAAKLGLRTADPEEILRAARRVRELRARVAREDPNMFCRFVLRDERNGSAIQQAPMHERWHKLLSDHDRLLIWSHVEGGKTNQIAIGRVLFELGRDPSLRVAVVSNTNDLAKKITRQLGQYIEKSQELHEVFPHLVPTDDPNLPWRAQALTIRRPGMGGKDPSIQACGMHGNIIGSRIDLLIFDDILDFENTHTAGPRDDGYRWVKNVMGRLTDGGRVWLVGNAWHPDDCMHRLEKDGFIAHRFPVVLPDDTVTWPERWSRERIERARGADGLGPLEFARQLMCQARDDTSSRFKKEWIDACVEAGEGLRYCESLSDLYVDMGVDPNLAEAAAEAVAMLGTQHEHFGSTAGVITGVDLAVSQKDSADETVLFTIHVDDKGRRRVLNIRAGRWTGPEIVNKIIEVYEDFGGLMIVENNAAQQYIVDQVKEQTAIPVVPFTTGRNKAHPEYGVESIATELANKKWLIPNNFPLPGGGRAPMHKEVSEWIKELLFYDPREHTGDRLMASWLAREGARRFVDRSTAPSIGMRVI